MPAYIVIIPATGPITVSPWDGSLAPLQAAVGGRIETAPLPCGKMLMPLPQNRGRRYYFNEEGALRGLPFNTRVSDCDGNPIYGTLVATCPTEELTRAVLARL